MNTPIVLFIIAMLIGIGLIVPNVWAWNENMTFDYLCEHDLPCHFNFNNETRIVESLV